MALPTKKSKSIGSGGYGCVFTPPLPCKKSVAKPTSKMVGKLMRKDNAEVELSLSTLVKSIPGYERYYVVPEKDHCEAGNFAAQRESYANQCEPFRKVQDSQLVQILSPYAGRTLRNYNYSEKFDFIDAFKHVLKGIAMLNEQGICHCDIKEDNLLVDAYGTIRIIDFGISFRGDQVSEEDVRNHQFPFTPEYTPEPPELALQRAMYKKLHSQYAIQLIMQKKQSIDKAALLLGLSKREQEESLREFWSFASAEPNWVTFYRDYWIKWDAWAVGVVFLNLLHKLLILPGFVKNQWIKESARVRPVLMGLLQADPRSRITAQEALSALG